MSRKDRTLTRRLSQPERPFRMSITTGLGRPDGRGRETPRDNIIGEVGGRFDQIIMLGAVARHRRCPLPETRVGADEAATARLRQTIGTSPSAWSVMPVIALVVPGPDVTSTTPGLPVERA